MAQTTNEQKTTYDKMLGGRLTLEQPVQGYRVAVDTFLLAAAAPVAPGDLVLDLGCGVGGVMLAIAARVPGIFATGIELQEDLALLCRRNIAANGHQDRIELLQGDSTRLPERLHETFDHVVMNPPFHDSARHDPSPFHGKSLSNTANIDGLSQWLAAAALALKDGGTMTVIFRADRQKELVEKTALFLGSLAVKPIATKPEGACKRILVRAIKGGSKKADLRPSFLLRAQDGLETRDAQALLRDGEAMNF